MVAEKHAFCQGRRHSYQEAHVPDDEITVCSCCCMLGGRTQGGQGQDHDGGPDAGPATPRQEELLPKACPPLSKAVHVPVAMQRFSPIIMQPAGPVALQPFPGTLFITGESPPRSPICREWELLVSKSASGDCSPIGEHDWLRDADNQQRLAPDHRLNSKCAASMDTLHTIEEDGKSRLAPCTNPLIVNVYTSQVARYVLPAGGL